MRPLWLGKELGDSQALPVEKDWEGIGGGRGGRYQAAAFSCRFKKRRSERERLYRAAVELSGGARTFNCGGKPACFFPGSVESHWHRMVQHCEGLTLSPVPAFTSK